MTKPGRPESDLETRDQCLRIAVRDSERIAWKKEAAKRDMTLSQFIRTAIDWFLKINKG